VTVVVAGGGFCFDSGLLLHEVRAEKLLSADSSHYDCDFPLSSMTSFWFVFSQYGNSRL